MTKVIKYNVFEHVITSMFDNDAPLHGLGFEIHPKKVVSKKKKALKVVNVAENVDPVVKESNLPEIVVS